MQTKGRLMFLRAMLHTIIDYREETGWGWGGEE